MSAAGSLGYVHGPAHKKESQQRESNPRPTAYESVALPTELHWLFERIPEVSYYFPFLHPYADVGDFRQFW